MVNITTIIDQESGIQYQGVEDRSSRTGTYPVIGLITGKFRRGRFDKPMTITNENIRAQLGYDPTNPYYIAVQDVLSAGVPSVQVLRVGQATNEVPVEPEYPADVMVMRTSAEVNSITIELQKGTHRIDWGDGTIESGVSGKLVHEYASFAEYIILIEKDSNEGGSDGNNTMVMTLALGVKEIIQWWSQGYEVLGFALNTSENQNTLVKVPAVTPRVFSLEQGGTSPIFVRCTKFNSQNILTWDVSKWGDFGSFFENGFEFNQPIGLHWNFGLAKNFKGFLQGCKKYNQPWPNFSSVNLTQPESALDSMFQENELLDQDFSKWCVSNISVEPANFAFGSKMQQAKMPIWGTCPNLV